MPRLFALLLLLLPLSAAAQVRGPQLPDYPADKVSAHVYVIHGPVGYPSPANQGFMNNPAFIVTDQGVVVVDPGSSVQVGEMVLRRIRSITDKPILAVLNTHVHGDHWLGNQAFREADPAVAIYAHPQMLAEVAGGAGELWVGNMEQLTKGATAGTRSVGPEKTAKGGDELKLGGLTYRFLHAGQAHSKTDLMIHLVEDELVFLADNACNRRIVRMDDGSFLGNIAALDLALGTAAKVWVPGHGKSGDKELVSAYRDYLDSLYRAVGTQYEAGRSDFEMKPQVAGQLARFADWPGFSDELGKHISLAVLEHEAAAFR